MKVAEQPPITREPKLRPRPSQWGSILAALLLASAGIVWWLLLRDTQPQQLNYQYTAAQLATPGSNTSGFYAPQTDAAGITYSWTQGLAGVEFDFFTAKPLKLTIELRSAKVAGGPEQSVRVLANGVEIGQLKPDPGKAQFQKFTLKFNPQVASPNNKKLKIELQTPSFKPGASDSRTLGTMVKSLELDASEAWTTLGKRVGLLNFVPGLLALILIFSVLAHFYRPTLWGRVAVLSCAAGVGLGLFMAYIVNQVGTIDRQIYQTWLGGTLAIVGAFGAAGVLLPWGGPAERSLVGRSPGWLVQNVEWRSLPKPIVLWLGVLGVGSFLLYGRFNWQEASGLWAGRAYLSSLYFFWLVVPVSYYLTLALSARRRLALGVAGVVFVVTALPYQWLGLGGLRYETPLQYAFDPKLNLPKPQYAWLPQAWGQVAFPGERLLFVGLLVAFSGLAFLIARQGRWRGLSRAEAKAIVWRIAPFGLVFFAIMVQTWLHLGMRSPYTYLEHFQQPEAKNYWYHGYMFPNNQGAVHGDIGTFLVLDHYFIGLPKESDILTIIIRRSFMHYLSSHFSYFINPFYTYLVLNTLLWFLSVLAVYSYVKTVVGKPKVALYAAALTACGNGFIFFVAQPMSYLANYAIQIFALYLYERILVQPRARLLQALLFGVVFGLFACVYDIFPLYPLFLLYSFFRKVAFWKTLVGFGASLVIYSGFSFLQFGVLNLKENKVNTQFSDAAIVNIGKLITNFEFGLFYFRTVELVASYAQNLGFAFFVLGLGLGFAGLLSTNLPGERILLGLLLLPSLLITAIFAYGNVLWSGIKFAEIARLSYIAWPAVYIGAALALWHGQTWLAKNTRLAKLAPALPWLVIGFILVWHNMDIFGLPSMNWHFYWPYHREWLDKI